MQIAAIIGGHKKRREIPPVPQGRIGGLGILAHDLLDAVGLRRGQGFVSAVEQGCEPIREPGGAARIGLCPERVETRGLAGVQGGVAPAIGAHRHLHAKTVIEDEDPRPCATGLGHRKGGQHRFAGPGPPHDQGMAAGRFFVGRSLLVIGKPVGALLRRGQICDDPAPGGKCCRFAELCPVEGRKIREVAVGDGAGADALGLVAGMLAEVMGLCGDPLADHLHAFGCGGVHDLRAEGLQFFERVAKERHDHVMLAEALALGLEIIGGDVEGFQEREGCVLARLHLALLSFDPACHEVGIDRREGMGDDHVDRQVQHVEHGAGGAFRVFPDGETLAVAMPHDAFRELEMIAVKRHAGIGDVDGQKAVGVCRVERQLGSCVERAQKSHQLPRCGGEKPRLELGEAREEDVHGLAQALQAFAGLLLQPIRRAVAEEGQEAFRRRAVNDGER